MTVLTSQTVKGIDYLLTTLTTILGKGAADNGQSCIAAAASLRDEVMSDVSDDGLQILIVVLGDLVVALALMPDEAP